MCSADVSYTTPPRYFGYWGKARPVEGADAAFHLLPYHCLDVAAVGVTYLRRAHGLRQWLQRELQCADEKALLDWVTFWLVLHDLGKFSEAFQSQHSDLFKIVRGRAPDPAKPYRVRHDSLGFFVWRDFLAPRAKAAQWFGIESEDYLDGIDHWARAVTGHHGQPPLNDRTLWTQHFDEREDGDAIRAFVDEARALWLHGSDLKSLTGLDPIRFLKASETLSWWIAGLAVLADWVGSNTYHFAYVANHETPHPLAEYWERALRQAAIALDATGVLPASTAHVQPLSALFPTISQPSPLQAWAADVPISAEPSIFMLEDVTGAGKTEAAVLLAHRLMAAGTADGFFIGLPTMATANAMYGRIAEVLVRLFGSQAYLVLAHGQRNLVEAFARTVLRPGRQDDDRHQSDETATARCTAWLADHNKRALLANVGVGTLDQALLAVLHSKHQSLRLLGLFRKVLIVDEVHACDDYMKRLLETLLEFHARAGGSAILLSATLPGRMKQSLLAAYARGRGARATPAVGAPGYPLTTVWHAAGPQGMLAEEALPSRPDVCRDVEVRYVCAESEVIEFIDEALAAGRCVCWMRNTVFDAIKAYNIFKDRLPPARLMLFHARFTLHDRLCTERKVLALFGKNSTPLRRRARLVIATQVAEQSLDADWDVVVSDLAPIDRLIQRAGRLQRHVRDATGRRLREPGARDKRGQPCLWVHGPAWVDAPASNWFKAKFPKAAAVYAHHGQLWLTAQLLQQGRIAMPGDARGFIEGVFGDDVNLPPGLQANADRTQGNAFANTATAQQNAIKLVTGYVREGIDWWSEAKTPSRLGEASTTVVLARWHGNQLRPWIERGHGWAYSTLRVSERLISRRAEGETPEREAVIRMTEEALPGKGKWSVIVPLSQTPRGWIGQAWTIKDDRRGERMLEWQYDAEVGLRQTPRGLDTTNAVEDNE